MLTLFSSSTPAQWILLVICLPVLFLAVRGLRLSVEGEDIRREADSRHEKRRERRLKSDAAFDLDDGNGNFSPGNARLVDLSVWGACISSTIQLKAGQRIRGRVRSPDEGRLSVAARVVWSRRTDNAMLYGISFDKVTRLPE